MVWVMRVTSLWCERERELGEDDVAVVRGLRSEVAEDDRVEQADDVRHGDLDDRRRVEARGERAALDRRGARRRRTAPGTARASAAACSRSSASWAAAVQNSISIRQVTTSVDRPRSTIATSCCQGSSNCAANSSIAATATRRGALERLDQHVLARAEVALQGADRHARRLGHVDEPGAGVAAVGEHRGHLVEHQRAPVAARSASATEPWLTHAPYRIKIRYRHTALKWS